MKVGIVGVGEMGAAMAGHLAAKEHDVSAYDVDRAKLKAIAARGITVADGLEALAKKAEIFLVVVSTDEQSAAVTETLSQHAQDGALIAVCATNHPNTMKELGELCASRGKRFIDAPVVYGASGAREGTLLSLCGGTE